VPAGTAGDGHSIRDASVKRKLIVALSADAALPAFAQQGGPTANVSMPTKAESQQVIQIISNDKTKTQQYCELGRINQKMAQADHKRDTRALEALGKQADELAEKIGPELVKFIDALDETDERSSAGKELMAAVETLDKLCEK
jgi:hypothetical protein